MVERRNPQHLRLDGECSTPMVPADDGKWVSFEDYNKVNEGLVRALAARVLERDSALLKLEDRDKRLAAVREWLKESPMSERISMTRATELLGIVGRKDEECEIVFDHLDAERWA